MKIDLKKLKEYIEKLNQAKILVIGDLALDEMVYGDTERISREAPVLILQHTHTKFILGGASNAAHNVSTINNGKISIEQIINYGFKLIEYKSSYAEYLDLLSRLDNAKKSADMTESQLEFLKFQIDEIDSNLVC